MCGRYARGYSAQDLADLFEAHGLRAELGPSWNVAPTQDVLVLVQPGDAHGDRGEAEPADGPVIDAFRWGLVPFWADDPGIGNRMINARAETVHEKPAFRAAFTRRRCLVLADGFYEWQRTPDGKVPHHVHRPDGAPFGLAGLWEVWRDEAAGHETEPLRTCTILTTAADDFMEPIHDRMPVLLTEPDDRAAWLDPTLDDKAELRALLDAWAAPELAAHPVSTEVNRPTNDGPQLVEPVGRAVGQDE